MAILKGERRIEVNGGVGYHGPAGRQRTKEEEEDDNYIIDVDTTSDRPLGMYKNVSYRYGNHKWETIR